MKNRDYGAGDRG